MRTGEFAVRRRARHVWHLCCLATAVATPSAFAATSLSQYGVTWTFDRDYPTGRFVNGDYWVVGPVTIVSIDPPSKTTEGRTVNGSMVNPAVGSTQGYDSATYAGHVSTGWDPSLNAAAGVSPENPLTLPPGSSLVSTISHEEAEKRPQLRAAAVLTVLAEPAPADAFRPPYVGADKKVQWRAQGMNTQLLRRLDRPRTMPDPRRVARRLQRPWIEQNPSWTGRYLHPSENQPDYGREISNTVGEAALLLHLDIPWEQKERLLIHLVQYGIDIYGAAREGAVWKDDGGHNLGRKLPLVLAGMMLGDADILRYADAATHRIFQEDRQTWYVTLADVGRPLQNDDGRKRVPYQLSDVGLPEWGEKHTSAPERDGRNWGSSYRTLTGHAFLGHALAARLLQAEPYWNHPAFFDYADRYWREERDERPGGGNAIRPFVHALWSAYRRDPAEPRPTMPLPTGRLRSQSISSEAAWPADNEDT